MVAHVGLGLSADVMKQIVWQRAAMCGVCCTSPVIQFGVGTDFLPQDVATTSPVGHQFPSLLPELVASMCDRLLCLFER